MTVVQQAAVVEVPMRVPSRLWQTTLMFARV